MTDDTLRQSHPNPNATSGAQTVVPGLYGWAFLWRLPSVWKRQVVAQVFEYGICLHPLFAGYLPVLLKIPRKVSQEASRKATQKAARKVSPKTVLFVSCSFGDI